VALSRSTAGVCYVHDGDPAFACFNKPLRLCVTQLPSVDLNRTKSKSPRSLFFSIIDLTLALNSLIISLLSHMQAEWLLLDSKQVTIAVEASFRFIWILLSCVTKAGSSINTSPPAIRKLEEANRKVNIKYFIGFSLAHNVISQTREPPASRRSGLVW
jgi:hypothetical protein